MYGSSNLCVYIDPAEFGFLGVIVEKLTDKSHLLPLYRTVHEIFTSYGSSFNSFEVIGSFSSFENLLPSSTLSRRKIFFTKHLRIQSHDLIVRTRDLSRSIPLPLILRESERSFSSLNLFIWNLVSEILSTTYVVLKGYLYDPIDWVKPAVATELGKSYILSLWTDEKGGSAGRGLYHERSKEGLKGSWKHIRTLEWNWKRDVTPIPSEMVRSLAQEEGADPYHLDLVLISLFF
ncbi:hypothetical protein GQ457_09G015890 [Hibiscus cannabinus]